MSAAIGGADIIFNTPYDAHFKKSNEFSSRLSKNQLLILKHEGYLDKVSNPADGAYYIESLTKQIAEKALQLIKDIEAKGGLIKMFFEGTIQRKIKEQANKELEKFTNKSITLTGVNIYEDKTQSMKSNMELYPFIKTKPRKTLIEPLMQKRLAEEWEQNRLKHE
jgi:methylmalonyl-CoA mutase